MIKNFAARETEQLFRRERPRKIPHIIHKVALRKLSMLDAAAALQDLLIPPANRLEKLKGDYEGFWSIRINDQWRITFHWSQGNAYDVKIIDYH